MASNTAFVIASSTRGNDYKFDDRDWHVYVDGVYKNREEVKQAIKDMLQCVEAWDDFTPKGWVEDESRRARSDEGYTERFFSIEDESLWDDPDDILFTLSLLEARDYGILTKYRVVEIELPETRKRSREPEESGSPSPKKSKPLPDWLAELIPEHWRETLSPTVGSSAWNAIKARLEDVGEEDVYPPRADIFAALRVPIEDVRVVILGQDPYHGPGQAHGLAFSVNKGVTAPPSLKNIQKQVENEFPGKCPTNLQPWVDQGVLLLNTTLTVSPGQAASHKNWGWGEVTDDIISAVNAACDGVVFMLWGKHAQGKSGLIDHDRHLVIETPHPSPLSAHRGFFDRKQFTEANEYLGEDRAIQWTTPEPAWRKLEKIIRNSRLPGLGAFTDDDFVRALGSTSDMERDSSFDEDLTRFLIRSGHSNALFILTRMNRVDSKTVAVLAKKMGCPGLATEFGNHII